MRWISPEHPLSAVMQITPQANSPTIREAFDVSNVIEAKEPGWVFIGMGLEAIEFTLKRELEISSFVFMATLA